MRNSLKAIFNEAKPGWLCEIKRQLKTTDRAMGFIVASSDELVLMHILDMDTFRLNGYSVLRLKDITHYRFFTKAAFWQARAVRHFKIKSRKPAGISLVSLSEALESIAKHHPLLTLNLELTKPNSCFIGSFRSLSAKTISIEDLNCNAEWTGPRRVKLHDITRIDFDTGYEAALAATMPKQK